MADTTSCEHRWAGITTLPVTRRIIDSGSQGYERIEDILAYCLSSQEKIMKLQRLTPNRTKEKILSRIVLHYLNSSDFNGISLDELIKLFNLSEKEANRLLSKFILDDLISIVYNDTQTNPNIRLFPDEPKESQVLKLKIHQKNSTCVYPLRKILKENVDPNEYENRPFSYYLALGEPQLMFLSFDLSVLEFYRNDPRYTYKHDDIQGYICVRDNYLNTEEMLDRDKLILESFGFCYDINENRAVAVFLRYLSRLSAEHQLLWQTRALDADYEIHPEYFHRQMGRRPQKTSIFNAFLEEMRVINRVCSIAGLENLFNEDYSNKGKPRDFGFIVRPTLREFGNFTRLLDFLISENINKEFLFVNIGKDKEKDKEEKTKSIGLLKQWLITKLHLPEKEIESVIKDFNKVRRLRSKYSHNYLEDEFDQKYFKEQRQLMRETYHAMRKLRLFCAQGLEVQNYKIEKMVQEQQIWDY